jgi:uncharacterized protein (TIGR02145 family)
MSNDLKEEEWFSAFMQIIMILITYQKSFSFTHNDLHFGNILVDIDGNNYHVVKIGNQIWMKENLRVSRYRNGDPIPKASNQEEWDKSYFEQKPAWCYVNDDSNTEKEYGKLYNWFAVNDPRGLAPEGYEIPTDKQWIKLQQELSGSNEPYNNSNDYNYDNKIKMDSYKKDMNYYYVLIVLEENLEMKIY